MIRTFIIIIIFFCLGIFAYAFYKENYSISNYDECILKKMRSVDSETAAKSLKKACSNKYENLFLINLVLKNQRKLRPMS